MLQFQFDAATAAKVAEHLETIGLRKQAADMWLGLCAHDPYDLGARRKLGDLTFAESQADYPPASIARSRFLLRVMGLSFPTTTLTQAYFENLAAVLSARPRRAVPGKVVLGLGTGRCGSTTLAAAMASVPGALATHETPPQINWEPCAEQVRFHFDRLHMLADYHALVFDAAHWWLPALESYFAEFPAGRAVALTRETDSCVRSFLSVKGSGRGSANHWAPAQNGIWASSPGDSSYPSYPLADHVDADPDTIKRGQIERYIVDYNHRLTAAAGHYPDRLLIVPMDQLNDPATLQSLSDFVGLPLTMPGPKNVGTTADSDRLDHAI